MGNCGDPAGLEVISSIRSGDARSGLARGARTLTNRDRASVSASGSSRVGSESRIASNRTVCSSVASGSIHSRTLMPLTVDCEP